MTWKRSIQTLIRHPLYLIMTLLPILLVCMLMFPLMQNFVAIMEKSIELQAYQDYYSYHEELSAAEVEQLIRSVMPLMGLGFLISLIALLSELLLSPIAMQYLGDATRLGQVPAGFAGRGLRRLWWKPFVYSLLLSLALNLVLSPILMIGIPILTALSPITGILGFLTLAAAFILGALIITMVTYMFYASIAMEDLPFFTAIGRAFSRTFAHFGRLLGASVSIFAVMLIPGLLLFIPLFSPIIHLAQTYGDSLPLNQIAPFFEFLLNRMALLSVCWGILAWLESSFLTSYSFQLTRECLPPIEPRQPQSEGSPISPNL